jgi:hypothetical protein
VKSASAWIDERIKELRDWRGKTLAKVLEIMHEADPDSSVLKRPTGRLRRL